MEIEITEKKDNKLLGRQEIKGSLKFSGATPSQKELTNELTKKLGVKPEQIFVLHIYTEYGATIGKFEVHVYESKEQLEKIVQLGKKAVEKATKPAEKKEEAPAAKPAEKKEEKPAEKKEEAKPEEKKEETKK